MAELSIVHWITVLISLLLLAIILVPASVVVRKAGYSGWWCLMWFVPVLNIVMLWVFAFANWPSVRQPRGCPPR